MNTVVVGQVSRDLVLRVDHAPGPHEAVAATEKIEMLGGKGANIAVGLAQLGNPVALLGVVGEDDWVLAQAGGVDVTHVVHRRGVATGMVVDIIDSDGRWHYVEYLPPEVLLTEEDVTAARDMLATAQGVVVQLQQPAAATLAAVRLATGFVVLDGTPESDEILASADVLRADRLTGAGNADEAIDAGRELLSRNDMTLVAFGVDGGDVFVWRDGARVVDTNGAGDALTAMLTSALLRGYTPEEAAELAAVTTPPPPRR